MIPVLNARLIKKEQEDEQLEKLTKREIEVLILLSEGLFNKEIAYKLDISERTVKNDISKEGIKSNINNVILTGQGIVNINKSDVAGKITLNIPVKISTGRLVSSVKSTYRVGYALVRYISARPYAKTVSSSIDTKKEKNILKTILEKVKDFFYS